MLNFKTQLLGAAAVVPIAAAGLLTSTGTAEAASLHGTIGLGGKITLTNTGSNPNSTKITFNSVNTVSRTGDFELFFPSVQPNSSTPQIQIKELTLTKQPDTPGNATTTSAIYSTGAIPAFIDFGQRTLGSITAPLTFDLDSTLIKRRREVLGGTTIISFDLEQALTGKFNFNGETIGAGRFSASLTRVGNSNSSSVYEITLGTINPPAPPDTVPEPTTLLGLGVVGAGMAFAGRRKFVKA
jgi:hypothetical protein